MCLSPGKTTSRSGFSFFELLVVVAMLGVIATLLITYVSPMRETTSIQVARQQQAELQTALGAWIAATSSGPGGLAAARGSYNGAGSKLGLLQAYLQPATYAALSGSGSSVSSNSSNCSSDGSSRQRAAPLQQQQEQRQQEQQQQQLQQQRQ